MSNHSFVSNGGVSGGLHNQHKVPSKVNPQMQIRNLILNESLEGKSNSKVTPAVRGGKKVKSSKVAPVIHGSLESNSRGGKKVKSSKVAPVIHGSLESNSNTKPSKKSKLQSPTKHVKKLRDSYVSFMMSLASNNHFTLGGATVAFGNWPCSAELARYPGRKPRIEKSEEELVYADFVLQTGRSGPLVAQVGQPRASPCAKKAIYPL